MPEQTLTPEKLEKLKGIKNPDLRMKFGLFYRLPQDLQEAMFSEDVSDKIWAIVNNKHGLGADKVRLVARTIGLVFLGETPVKNFIRELKESLGVSTEKAAAIAQDINKEIFQPVRESLMDVHDVGRTITPEQAERIRQEASKLGMGSEEKGKPVSLEDLEKRLAAPRRFEPAKTVPKAVAPEAGEPKRPVMHAIPIEPDIEKEKPQTSPSPAPPPKPQPPPKNQIKPAKPPANLPKLEKRPTKPEQKNVVQKETLRPEPVKPKEEKEEPGASMFAKKIPVPKMPESGPLVEKGPPQTKIPPTPQTPPIPESEDVTQKKNELLEKLKKAREDKTRPVVGPEVIPAEDELIKKPDQMPAVNNPEIEAETTGAKTEPTKKKDKTNNDFGKARTVAWNGRTIDLRKIPPRRETKKKKPEIQES